MSEFVEMRTYRMRPGNVRRFVEIYRRDGAQVQTRHLGAPMGYYITEVGDVNDIVHLWAYESMADRDARRAALFADPAWSAYVEQIDPLLHSQRSALLRSVDLAPAVATDALEEARSDE